MVERSAVTARPVLAGAVPGVAVTVNTDDAPGNTEFGLAAPTPEGLVETGAPIPRIETLSIAKACAFVVTKPEVTE